MSQVFCFLVSFFFFFPLPPTFKYLYSQEASEMRGRLGVRKFKLLSFLCDQSNGSINYLPASNTAVRKRFPASFKVTATSISNCSKVLVLNDFKMRLCKLPHTLQELRTQFLPIPGPNQPGGVWKCSYWEKLTMRAGSNQTS